MEEQKSSVALKKKPNVVDVIAVILIVLVAIFAIWRILGPKDDLGDVNMIDVTYTVRVEGVPKETYENCQRYIPSRLMASGKLVGGQITGVRAEPYLVLSPGNEWVEDPNLLTLYFTVETQTEDLNVLNEGKIVDVVWGKDVP